MAEPKFKPTLLRLLLSSPPVTPISEWRRWSIQHSTRHLTVCRNEICPSVTPSKAVSGPPQCPRLYQPPSPISMSSEQHTCPQSTPLTPFPPQTLANPRLLKRLVRDRGTGGGGDGPRPHQLFFPCLPPLPLQQTQTSPLPVPHAPGYTWRAQTMVYDPNSLSTGPHTEHTPGKVC